eukprot:gene43938-59514_t
MRRQQVLPGDDALLRPLAQQLHQEQAHQKQLEAAATAMLASSKGGVLDDKQLVTAYHGRLGLHPASVEDAPPHMRAQRCHLSLLPPGRPGPVNSKITTEAIAATSRDGVPTFLAIDSAEAISQNHPMYEASEIPAGAFGGSPDRPEDDVKTISFAHHIVARRGLSDAT